MSDLFDIDHVYGNGLNVSITGDIAVTSGLGRSQQRVLRRLMTNPQQVNPDGSVLPADYIAHPDYGAGLPRHVGGTLNIPEIVSAIRSQLTLEDSVADLPEPSIRVTPLQDGLSVYLKYTDSESNQQTVLSFNATK